MPLEELNDGHSSFENENTDSLKRKIFAHILVQNPILEWKILNSQPVEDIDQRIQIVSRIVNQELDDVLQTEEPLEKMSYALEAQIFIRDSKTVRTRDYGEDTKNERRLIRLKEQVVLNALSRMKEEERLVFANFMTEEVREEYMTGLEERGEFTLGPLLEWCIQDIHDAIMNATFTRSDKEKLLLGCLKRYLQNFIYSVLIVCKKQGKCLHASIARYTGVSRKHSHES